MTTHNREGHQTSDPRASGREYHIKVVKGQVTNKGFRCIYLGHISLLSSKDH